MRVPGATERPASADHRVTVEQVAAAREVVLRWALAATDDQELLALLNTSDTTVDGLRAVFESGRREGAERMLRAAIVAVDSERLEDETGDSADIAYQSAINDTLRALRALPTETSTS